MLAINFEVYTCNPATGETGWDIKFPTVYAGTVNDGKEILKKHYPNFDCVILHNYSIGIKGIDLITYAGGAKYRDTTEADRYN